MMLLLLSLLISPITAPKAAHAFDPFTIAMVASSVANAVSQSGIGDTAGAVADLYGEIDTDASLSESGQKMIENVNQINQMVSELGYNMDDISDLMNGDGSYYVSVADQIRKVTKALRAAKRIKNMFSSLEKKAQGAQIESNEIAKQQLATQNAILIEEQNHSLEAIKTKLHEAIEKKNEIAGLKSKLNKNGIKTYKTSKITTFPLTEGVLEAAIAASEKLRPILFAVMFVLFGIKLVYHQFRLDNHHGYQKLLRDVILTGVLLTFYPEVLRFILTCAAEIASYSSQVLGHASFDVIDPKEFKPPEVTKGSWWTNINFEYFRQWIIYCAYAWAKFWMTLGLGIMILAVPIVLTLSIMLGWSMGWGAYMGLIIIFALWPTIWNLIGIAGELLWSGNADPLECAFYGTFLSIFQMISPMFAKNLLHGHGPVDTLSQSAQTISKVAGGTLQHAGNLAQGYKSTGGGAPMQGRGLSGAVGGITGKAVNGIKNTFQYSKAQASSRPMHAINAIKNTEGTTSEKMKSGFRAGLMNSGDRPPSVGGVIDSFKNNDLKEASGRKS